MLIPERAHGSVGQDGDPAVEGLRLDARDLAGNAGGVRSLAGTRSRERDHRGTPRRGQSPFGHESGVLIRRSKARSKLTRRRINAL